MILKGFLIITMGIILPIMYFVLKGYGNPHGEQIFGITIGSHHMQEEEIKKTQKQYIKEMNRFALLALVLLVGSIAIPYFSIFYTALMVWMFGTILLLEIPFMKANSAMKKLKVERGWNGEFAKEIAVDTEVAKQQDRFIAKKTYILSGIIAVLPMIASAVFAVRGKIEVTELIPSVCLFTATAVVFIMGILMQRVRLGAICKDSAVNQAVARVKRYHWSKGMAGCTLATALFGAIATLDELTGRRYAILTIVTTLCYLTFVLCWLFYTVYKAYEVKTKLIAGQEPLIIDDDDHWFYGMFYYNKDDSSFMIEKRVGIGTTVNMARPAAKVTTVILSVILLIVPVSCVWMIADEFTPVSLSITDQALESHHFEGTYSLSLEEIKKVELLHGLPDCAKLVGTGLDNLFRGSFNVEGYDKCTVCLDPENDYFIAVTMESGKTYIFSDETDAGTKAVYDKLLFQSKNV